MFAVSLLLVSTQDSLVGWGVDSGPSLQPVDTLRFSFGFSYKIKKIYLSSVIPNLNLKHWFCKILLQILSTLLF